MSRLFRFLKLGSKLLHGGKPLALIYFVTHACNAKCAHCFFGQSLNTPRDNELTVDEVEKIARSIGSMLYLRLSGGEPFIREELFELVQAFAVHCQPIYIGVPTNGFYTDRAVAFAQRAARLDTRMDIGISIDDLGERHDRIRGSRHAFERALETFHALMAVKERVPNLTVGFTTTAMKSNRHRLLELFELLSSLEPDGIACNIVRDDPRVKEEKEIDAGASFLFSALCDDYNGKRLRNRGEFFGRMRQAKTLLAHEIRRRTIETGSYQTPCVAGTNIAVMYADGEVHPCETLGFEIGNIRDHGLDMLKLLQSDRAHKIRAQIIRERCFCSHECFISASVTFRKRQLWKVIRNEVLLPHAS